MMSDVVLGNVYDKYNTKNPLARLLFGNFLNSARVLLDSLEVKSILEVGCGEGKFAALLRAQKPDARICGVDISENVFDKEALTESRVDVCVQSAHSLGFSASSFDLVVAVEVLEHLEDPEQALEEICRVAREHVLLSVPREPLWRVLNVARLSYLRDFGNTPGHLQHWSSRGFVRLVSRFFEPVKILRPLPWTMVLARQFHAATAEEDGA